MPASSEHNLTGVWAGAYTYRDGTTVTFTATLLQSGGHLSGTVHEPDTFAGTGQSLNASVTGSTDGRSVTFRKQYERVPRGFTHKVDYRGSLLPEGEEIEGTWRITGWLFRERGTFLMVRERRQSVPEGEVVQATVGKEEVL